MHLLYAIIIIIIMCSATLYRRGLVYWQEREMWRCRITAVTATCESVPRFLPSRDILTHTQFRLWVVTGSDCVALKLMEGEPERKRGGERWAEACERNLRTCRRGVWKVGGPGSERKARRKSV
eukprot:2804756-Rhodomonas_salina.3